MCTGRDFDPTVNPVAAGLMGPMGWSVYGTSKLFANNAREVPLPAGGPLSQATPDLADKNVVDAEKRERLNQLMLAGYRSTFLSGPRGPGGPSRADQNRQLNPGIPGVTDPSAPKGSGTPRSGQPVPSLPDPGPFGPASEAPQRPSAPSAPAPDWDNRPPGTPRPGDWDGRPPRRGNGLLRADPRNWW